MRRPVVVEHFPRSQLLLRDGAARAALGSRRRRRLAADSRRAGRTFGAPLVDEQH